MSSSSLNSSAAMPKLMQAESWLRAYLKDGPQPIPDSFIKNGQCRYNYQANELPPSNVGKKLIDQAIQNLGVIVSRSGPRGGKRWTLPENPDSPLLIARAEREKLARKIEAAFKTAFDKLEEHRTDIERLWKEFDILPSGETILGCRTKKDFCEKVLHRGYRAIRYMLTGGNPVCKRSKRETVSCPIPVITTKQRSRLLKAATIVGTELIPAFEKGQNIDTAIAELKKIAFDSAELSVILESRPERTVSIDEADKEIRELALAVGRKVINLRCDRKTKKLGQRLVQLLSLQRETETPAKEAKSIDLAS